MSLATLQAHGAQEEGLSPASDYVPSWSVELICRALVLNAPDIAILLAGHFRPQGERHGTNV
jgi:hypothetical protein